MATDVPAKGVLGPQSFAAPIGVQDGNFRPAIEPHFSF
jgi:hypothetical protein